VRALYLIDSSAWIEYFRKTGSPAHLEVKRLLADSPDAVAMTEPVMLELLAGAPTSHAFLRLQALCRGLPMLSVEAPADCQDAAAVYRTTRAAGLTVRKLLDCLIAAVALRTQATLVHRDMDFDAIAKAIPALKVRSLR
jgi:predicted nucleic acid-binding protein